MELHFVCLSFDQLTPHELYEILSLRQEVFVVEQNCPYLDTDGKDQASYHLMCRNGAGELVAYTRLLPKGASYPEFTSIGRVINKGSVRGKGIGKALMQKSIDLCHLLFGPWTIKIGAQSYLLGFYESLGFVSTGEEYLEDGIPHTKMLYAPKAG